MFTGIIENLAKVEKLKLVNEILHVTFQSDIAKELYIGQSISHNGVCLSVEKFDNNYYELSIIKETLSKTNLGNLKINDQVNIERALLVGSRLDGHFVQGHVDCCGIINKKVVDGDNLEFEITFPKNESFEKLVVRHGSIAVDGISLTIAKLNNEFCFSVCLIPHTLNNTTAKNWDRDVKVNLEFDLLAKYIIKSKS